MLRENGKCDYQFYLDLSLRRLGERLFVDAEILALYRDVIKLLLLLWRIKFEAEPFKLDFGVESLVDGFCSKAYWYTTTTQSLHKSTIL